MEKQTQDTGRDCIINHNSEVKMRKNTDWKTGAKILLGVLAVVHICAPILAEIIKAYLVVVELVKLWQF